MYALWMSILLNKRLLYPCDAAVAPDTKGRCLELDSAATKAVSRLVALVNPERT